MVGPGGLEPPTSRLSGVRSNHLSYGPPGIRLDRNSSTDIAVRQVQHLDELEIGVNSRLAGTQNICMTHPVAEPQDQSQTDYVCVCVKKEKRRRREFRSFDRFD